MSFVVNVVYCRSYVEISLCGNVVMWFYCDVVVSCYVVLNGVVSSDFKT